MLSEEAHVSLVVSNISREKVSQRNAVMLRGVSILGLCNAGLQLLIGWRTPPIEGETMISEVSSIVNNFTDEEKYMVTTNYLGYK